MSFLLTEMEFFSGSKNNSTADSRFAPSQLAGCKPKISPEFHSVIYFGIPIMKVKLSYILGLGITILLLEWKFPLEIKDYLWAILVQPKNLNAQFGCRVWNSNTSSSHFNTSESEQNS